MFEPSDAQLRGVGSRLPAQRHANGDAQCLKCVGSRPRQWTRAGASQSQRHMLVASMLLVLLADVSLVAWPLGEKWTGQRCWGGRSVSRVLIWRRTAQQVKRLVEVVTMTQSAYRTSKRGV